MKRTSHHKVRLAKSGHPLARIRRPRPLGVSLARYSSIVAVCGALFAGAAAQAAVVYLDTNGTTIGSGINGSSTITWDGSAIWNSFADGGAGSVAAWTGGDVATFAAGTDAGTPFGVAVSETQSIGGLVFEEGRFTLTGGTLQMAVASDFNVTTNLTATVNSVVDGAFNLTKTGAGTLVLGGTNTYGGNTLINAGTLSISSDANLGSIPGAVTPDSINFTGSSTLQVTGTGNPAINSNRGITINTGVTGTVQIVDSANTVSYGGVINGEAGTTFKKTGAGTLDLQGNSTSAFHGALNVDGGTLKLSGSGEMAGASGVTIGNRATLTLDNSGSNLGDRLGGTVTSNGGTINFTGNVAATSETTGALTLNAGALTINSTAGAGGNILTIPSITRNAGGTLYASGNGLGGTLNQIVTTSAPTLTNNIVPWAVVNDGALISFATHSGVGTTLQPLALASHNQGAMNTWTATGATSNARPLASVGDNAARSVYSITLDSGVNIAGTTATGASTALSADRTLTITGPILQTSGSSQVTSNGAFGWKFAFGGSEAIFNVLGTLTINRGSDDVYNSSSSTTGATLSGNGGFTKSGAGTLILNSESAITGTYRINEGVLELQRGAALNGSAQAIHLNGGTLRLTQTAGTGTATTFIGNLTVNADSTVTVSRVDNPATATTHTVGSLSIGGDRRLTVNSNNITSGTAYGLTTGTVAITGPATFDVANNGAGTGTVTLNSVTNSGGATITKLGGGDLVTIGSSTSGFGSPIDIQAGRVGWSTATVTINEAAQLMGAGGIVKSGSSSVNLTSVNTFTGGISVLGGTLGFSTVSNNGGAPSNLGQGTDGITLGGSAPVLSFIGSTSQSTNRAMTVSASGTLDSSGTGGATITYAGPISAAGNSLTLTGNATSSGVISGGMTQTGTAAKFNINSGTWTLSGTPATVADDVVVTGATAVLNLNTTGVLNYTTGSSNGLYSRSGAVINLGADDAAVVGGLDLIVIGDSGAVISTLNTGGFNISTPRLDVGQLGGGLEGAITGDGTLTVTTDFNLYRGSIAANLVASTAVLQKLGTGILTLSGDNSGLGGTTQIELGDVILDYATDNHAKISSTGALDMRGASLTLNGSSSAATVQSVGGLTLASGGFNLIDVNSGIGRSATLNLGTITRGTGQGVLRLELPTSGAITATNPNVHGILGGWATIVDATGTWFASNDGVGNLIAVSTSGKDDTSTWAAGDQITDVAGFTGTVANGLNISSLRFNAAAGSTLNLGGLLHVAGGGVLSTSNVAGDATMAGGTLSSGLAELFFTQDSAQTLTVSSAMVGTGALTKSGSGVLRLSGTNMNTGTVTIQAGTVQVTGGNAIGDTAPVTLNAANGNPVFEVAAGQSETIGALSGGSATAGDVLIGAGSVLTVNEATPTTYSGTFTGGATSTFRKIGSPTLIVAGSSSATFTGPVVIDQGLLQLNGASGSLAGASSYTLNGGELLSDQDQGSSVNRLGDSAPITLNNTAGTRGLWVRNVDETATRSDNIGPITLGAGHNVIQADPLLNNSGTIADMLADSLSRGSNHATALVRGLGLGNSSGRRGQIRFSVTQPADAVGGIGGAGTTTIPILPYLVGDNAGIAGLGKTLVTNTGATNGLRPLSTTVGAGEEYIHNEAGYNGLGAGVVTNNVRFTLNPNPEATLANDTTGINALVLDSTTEALTVTGDSGVTLQITSGAINAYAGTAANVITLGGFAGIAVSGTNDYIIHVPVAGSTFNLNSRLTTGNPLVKAGAGTLVLGVVSNAHTDTYFNQGLIQAASLAQLGGGNLNFFGGGLQWAENTSFDVSSRTTTFGLGGATFDTNGNDVSLNAPIGNGGAGGFTKANTGNLTLNAAATYLGSTSVTGGTLTMGVNQAISGGDLTVNNGTFAMQGFNATVGNITLVNAAGSAITGSGTLTSNGTATLNQGAIDVALTGSMNLVKPTASVVVSLNNTNSSFTGSTWVQDGVLKIASIADAGVNSSIGAPTGENAAMRLGSGASSGALNYLGDTASTNRKIYLVGTTGGGIIDNDGTGALTVSGNVYAVETGAKALTLQGTAGTIAAPNTFSGAIEQYSSVLGVTKNEAGAWIMSSGNNHYSGITQIDAGTLIAGHDQAFSTSTINLSGGSLAGDGTARTLANAITIDTTSAIGGASDLALNGNFSQTGGDRILTVDNTGATTFGGAVTLDRGSSNGNLTISANTGATVNISNLQDGAGTGTGSLTKTGVGALNITNAFNLAGNLFANGGTTTLSGAGATVVSGNLQVGRGVSAASTLIYSKPTGSLSVGSGVGNSVEFGVTGGTVAVDATVDFTGLGSFTANVGAFRVGSFSGTSGTSAKANVKLATDNNITAATTFEVGNNNNGGSGLIGPVSLQFGSGTNLLKTPTVIIGNGKGAGTSVGGTQVNMATGGSLTINNGAGVATDLSVGVEDVNTGTIMQTVFDLSGGTLTATLDDVVIAQRSLGGAGTNTATFTIGTGANAVTANTLKIGSNSSGTGATGTLNFGGGTFTLANDVAMASSTGAVRGTLNIAGGTFSVGGDITKSSTTNGTAVVIVDGASTVLEMTSGTIAASQLAFRGGSINNIAAGGVTLDASSATTGTGSTGDALILRDVTLNSAVTLTGASGGAIHYESAGGGTGGTVTGTLDMGVVGRTFNVEDSAAASADLTLGGDLTGDAGFTKTGAGALRLSGATAQTFTGNVAIQEGRLILGGGADQRIAAANLVTLGTGANSAILQLGDALGKSDFAPTTLAFSGTGTAHAIVGGSASLSTFTINPSANTVFPGTIGGAGTNESKLNLVKNGSATLTFPGTNNISGAITVNGGILNGGFGATGTSISVAGGAALNFVDGGTVARTLATGNVLTLGGGSTLGFDVGNGDVDQILGVAGSTASVRGAITIDLFSIGGISPGTYSLLSMPGGGLMTGNGSSGSYVINSAPGGFLFSLNPSDTLVQLTIGAINIPTMYWRNGLGDNSWSSLTTGSTNWATDDDGTLNAGATPGSATDVFFSASNEGATAISTTLDGLFNVKSLTFTGAPTGVTSVSIAPGTPLASTLTIEPTNATSGIDVQDSAGAVTISAGVVLGANQAWTVSNTGASLVVSGNITGSGNLEKLGAGIAVLTGTNSYSGTTTITAGTLQVGDGGTTGTLGSGAVTNNASLVFNYGAGASVAINSAIGGFGNLTKVGAGAVLLGSANTYTGKTIVTGGALQIGNEDRLGSNPASFVADQLTLDGGALQTPVTVTIDDANRGITLGASGGTLIADPSTTMTIGTALSGSGGLILAGAGTVAFSANQTLSDSANTLTFGATNGNTTVSKLDLGAASATFGGNTLVQTNSATANTLAIGDGRTLTLNGNVTIGANSSSGTTTKLTATGLGSLLVNKSGGLFQVGGAIGATNSNTATLDLSGLAVFEANLGTTGTFKVGDLTTNTSNSGASTVKLAKTSTIIADVFSVGGNTASASATQTVTLGDTATYINANRLEIGAYTLFRGKGLLNFSPATTGTLQVRAADTTGPAAMYVSYGPTAVSTGNALTASVVLTGHDSNLLLSTLGVGGRAAGTGTGSDGDGTFAFDTGHLTATTVELGFKTGTNVSTAEISGLMTLGGGIVDLTTVGLGRNTTSTGAAKGTLTFSGSNTTTIGSINMAAATTLNGTATGVLNLNGGNITVNGDILRTGGNGTSTATVTLAGATLDMTNGNIGGANAVNFIAESGTLKNVFAINGDGGLTKTTGNTLILDGTNSYTGSTAVNGGTLRAAAANSFSPSSAVVLADTAGVALDLNGFDQTIASLAGGGATGGNVSLGAGKLTVGTAGGTATFDGVISGGNATHGLTKIGASTQVLSGTNTYTGPTTVSAGSLEISGSIMGSTSVDVTGGSLLLSGSGNKLNDATPISLTNGTLAFANTVNGFSENLGVLTLSGISTIDFGSGAAGNTFQFDGLSLSGFTGLNVYGWTGTADGLGNNQDHLTFEDGATHFDINQLAQIAFYGDNGDFLGTGNEISFGGSGFEIVAVPEPSSTALLGAAGLLGLVGFRERRRLSGLVGRKGSVGSR